MRPWEYHSDLTSERLIVIAQLLAAGRGVALDRYDPTVGDDAWTRGVCAYNYGRYQINHAAAQKVYDWLFILDGSRRFQFRIGQVPLRFYRGQAADPSARMLVSTPIELEQYSLNLEDGMSLSGVKFRIAIETDSDGSIIQISFVAIRGDAPEAIWPIPYENAPPLLVTISEERPEGRELDAPIVDLPDDDSDEEADDTSRSI